MGNKGLESCITWRKNKFIVTQDDMVTLIFNRQNLVQNKNVIKQ